MAKGYRHLRDFARLIAPFEWIDGAHHDLIFEALERVERRECRRLIINIPPGYGKSFDCSRAFPVWCLMRHPTWDFFLTSYGDDLAEEHSAAARQFYQHWVPKITGGKLDSRSEAVDRWLTDSVDGCLGGGMRACGINSAVTGRRADIAVIDDPYKNWKEASSEAIRASVLNTYRSAIRNRLRPKGCIVIIHTRWHKDDITGSMLEEMASGTGEKWEVLKLAARATDGDVLGRPLGAPLWPEYYDERELVEMEMSTGSYFWEAQHQQEPEDPGGKMFRRDWLRYFECEGDYYVLHRDLGDVRYHRGQCLVFQTVDCNGSAKSRADFFVISTFCQCPGGELLLLDVYREHIGVEEHLTQLDAAYGKWYPAAQYVENKTFGTNLIALAVAEGLPVFPVPAEDDKLTRSVTAMTRYRNGMVFHPKSALWVGTVEHELMEFPGGKHDDFVDTVSIAGIQSVDLMGWGTEMASTGGDERVGSGFGLSEGSDEFWGGGSVHV